MEDAQLIYIADVYCPWCFAFGPIMKRLASEHPEFSVRVLGGNLISRPMTLEEDVMQSPGLVDFWREVEETSGRSLDGAIQAVLEHRNVRLYSPGADEFLAVLREFCPGQELAQMLYMEDLFYGKGLDIFSQPVMDQIAEDWEIDPARFERALDQPAALEATERNLRQASRLMGEITSYPSVILRRGNRIDAVSRGYVHYETVLSRLEDVMRDLGLAPDQGENCSLHNNCSLGGRKARQGNS